MLELKMVHVAKTAVCNAVRRKQKEAGRSQAETCTLCDSAVGTDKGIVHGNGRICEEPSGVEMLQCMILQTIPQGHHSEGMVRSLTTPKVCLADPAPATINF